MSAPTAPAMDARLLAVTRHGGPATRLLLHGYLGSARNLGTLARRLAARDAAAGVVCFDLTGHGASPPLPPGADLETLARDVLHTVAELGLPPLRVLGHSLGGRVAMTALRLPGGAAAISELTLLDVAPTARATSPETVRIVEVLAAAPADAASRDDLGAALRTGGLAASTIEWLLTSTVRDAGSGRYHWRFDRAALAALMPSLTRDDLWPVIEAGTTPARCIRGGRSRYVSEDDAARLRAAGCPVDTIAGAGHHVHVDALEELLALLP